MIAIYTSAAAIDSEAAAELKEALEGRRANAARFIQESAAMLRDDLSIERATAVYFSLTWSEGYQQLVHTFGWTPDEYERWLANLLRQQLLP
jgi:hypothetical protein